MEITLKRDGTCADCGASLPAGTRARWYRNGTVFGLDCHEKGDARPKRARRGRSAGARASHYDPRGVYSVDGRFLGTAGPRCEDAPCCGCCS